jgi:hypothetical protein
VSENQSLNSRSGLRRPGADTLVALGLLAVHIIAVLGYTGVFWGDIGRWSHEVERFATGETPYRDFQWHYPPLGLWVEGTAARFIGTDRAQLTAITGLLTLLLVLAAVRYGRVVLDRSDAWFGGVALVLALSYAQSNGAPLPLGLYSPAALVGSLCIIVAAAMFVRHLTDNPGRVAELSALFAGLSVLAKQDFWLPALTIVGVIALRSRRWQPPLVFAGVVTLGVLGIVASAGVAVLPPLLGGFGHAKLAGGQGFPSWERLTVEIFVLALILGGLTVVVSFARRTLYWKPLLAAAGIAALSGGVHIGASMTTTLPEPGSLMTMTQDRLFFHLSRGNSLVRPAIGLLRDRVAHTPIPVLLPPILLAIVALRWSRLATPRRAVIATLLAFAIALRARRAFEGSEWFEFLLTVPVVLATLELLLAFNDAEQRRFRLTALSALSVCALLAYAGFGRGVGTRKYYPEPTSTLRGTVHVKPGEARNYRNVLAAIDSVDPARRRPLYAYGFSGGFNYFMKRRNPFPFTQDFYFSAFNADSVLAQRPPGVFLVDNPALDDMSFAAAKFDWRSWEQPRVAAPYGTYDRVRFDRLKSGCAIVPTDTSMFTLYSCP